MKNILCEISQGVWGIALWSSEWETYINCYIVRSGDGFCLIDAGSKQHLAELPEILSSAGIAISKIHTIIATHGHIDHIGNIALFPNAVKLIHGKDINVVENHEKELFECLENDNGVLPDFEWTLIGGHTPGSIALYHKASKVIFAGDAICFFGTPLPEEGLISHGVALRDLWHEYIASGELAANLRSQDMSPADFGKGLRKLAGYDISYLCTGHGAVLEQDIPSFLNALADEIMNEDTV